MAFQQYYFPITAANIHSNLVAEFSSGQNGILLAVEAVWWPSTIDADGFATDGVLRFDLKDGSGKEMLGTDTVAAQRVVLSKDHNYYLWKNPNHADIMRAMDLFRLMDYSPNQVMGLFSNGLLVHSFFDDPANRASLVVQVQVLELA